MNMDLMSFFVNFFQWFLFVMSHIFDFCYGGSISVFCIAS